MILDIFMGFINGIVKNIDTFERNVRIIDENKLALKEYEKLFNDLFSQKDKLFRNAFSKKMESEGLISKNDEQSSSKSEIIFYMVKL